ncbi:BrnA antitoxin family protein [Brevundimonas sp.]|uniref:BrnA antitoxin family protein n=1 Tax=Brevundimonas sp. TaxID=1871086 RepID=UPI002E13FD43|nr:BrnA antitoxin family protein [Brevundimonas sp.]
MNPDDAPELSEAAARSAVRGREILSDAVLDQFRRSPGRPRSERPKVPVSLRLDADVVERFRATGDGWQSRINELLRAAASALPANDDPERADDKRA